MQTWVLKQVLGYCLPLLMEFLLKKLLSSRAQEKIRNKEDLVDTDIADVLNRLNLEKRLPEK